MKAFEFKPKSIHGFKKLPKELFMADPMAGIIVGIVACRLPIAFGIASGVSPGERYYHGNHRRFYHLPVRRK